jgi:hypothetical protein
MPVKPRNRTDLRIVFWSLSIGLILLLILLFLIPALLGSGGNPTVNPAQETGNAVYATRTVMQRVIGAMDAAWTATAKVTPEPDDQ